MNYKIERHRVTGIQHYEKDFLKKLGHYNCDYDLTKKEIKEKYFDGDTIYQYTFYDSELELVPEPDNPYDSNAIKVMISGVHIGYIKKGSCSRVKNLLSSPDLLKVDVSLYGGKYKYVSIHEDDDGDEKTDVESRESSYRADIDFYIKTSDVSPGASVNYRSKEPRPASVEKHPVIGKGIKFLILFTVLFLTVLYILARI